MANDKRSYSFHMKDSTVEELKRVSAEHGIAKGEALQKAIDYGLPILEKECIELKNYREDVAARRKMQF